MMQAEGETKKLYRRYLDKGNSIRLVQLSRRVSVLSVRADEGRDGHESRVGEEFGDLCRKKVNEHPHR